MLRICQQSLSGGGRIFTPLSCIQAQWAHRTRKTKNRKRREKDDADLSWAEPMLEYKAEKAAQEASGETEPHMLHVVWRTQPVKGRPWWERQILTKFDLDKNLNDPVILKNTAYVNKRLNEVKHLLRIRPLTFPHGLPEHESDFEHTEITLDGEFLVKKRLPNHLDHTKYSDPAVLEDKRAKWRFTNETLDKHLMYIRENHLIHSEYHDAEYVYKRNQDGKEYRYNFNKQSD